MNALQFRASAVCAVGRFASSSTIMAEQPNVEKIYIVNRELGQLDG